MITNSNQEEVLSLILFLVCMIRDIFVENSLILLFLFVYCNEFTARLAL